MKNKLLILLVFSIYNLTYSQCFTKQTPLDQRVNTSSYIVEGEIIAQHSYWDATGSNIYTVHLVKPYKSFKGNVKSDDTIQFITLGGTVGFTKDVISGAKAFAIGDKGVFILESSPVSLSIDGNFLKLVENNQGYIDYDVKDHSAHDGTTTYTSIENQLYKAIEAKTGLKAKPLRQEKILSDTKSKSVVSKSSLATGITNLNPTSFHGGVSEILTITGTDFGTDVGTVNFRDANSGATNWISAYDSDILSWTNTEIQVKVISRASTGNVQVITSGGTNTVASSQTITVLWSHSNVTYDLGSGDVYYENNLRAKDANGGYIFQYAPNFSSTDARDAFQKTIETWNCATGVNFEIGVDHDTNTNGSDNINIVMWQTSAEIGSSTTAAYVRSRYSGCGSASGVSWYVKELEVVCNSDVNWYYGSGTPSGAQYDFETVLLHEIGHGHQLGHVGQTDDVMFYRIDPGVKNRNLSTETINGADYVFNKSTTTTVCGQPSMTAFSGTACCNDPVVTSNPNSATACESNNIDFSVEGDYETAYQWQVQIGGSGGFTDITDDSVYSGSQTNTLDVLGVPFSYSGNVYRCVLSNSCTTTATSNSATLTVYENPSATISKTNATCNSSGSITFSFPDNSARTGIEFSIDGGTNYTEVADNSGSYTFTNLTEGDYDLIVRWGNTDCPLDLGEISIATDGDTTDPVISAKSTFTLDLDTDGEATLQVSDIDTGSTDNCGIATYTLSQTDFDGTDLGDSVQTLTVEDTSGNDAVHNFTLTVRDQIIPVITLIGNSSITIEKGGTYNELGATASDNVDGNITDGIEITDNLDLNTVGTYSVRYNVVDASGNDAVEVVRTVNVVDTTAPVITLNGANPQTVNLGDGYTELGATTDDGSTVTIDDSEFMDAVGSYTIYYDATDASGNDAIQVTRTVNVEDTTLSNSDIDFDRVLIFPNPTSDIVNILGAQNLNSIKIYNVKGQLLKVQKQNLEKINLEQMSNGIYFLKLETATSNKIIKIIKSE